MQHILLIMSHLGNKVLNDPVTKSWTSEPSSFCVVVHNW